MDIQCPLVCKGGLMYLKFQGIPRGELDWNNDSTENFQFVPKFNEFDDYINKSLSITPQSSSIHDLMVNKHTTLGE